MVLHSQQVLLPALVVFSADYWAPFLEVADREAVVVHYRSLVEVAMH